MMRWAIELFGFTSNAISPAWGTSSESEALRHQLDADEADAREVAARSGETGDEA